MKGFRDFIMRGNVVDLAVAVIMGAAFNQVVNSMVSDVLTPLIGAIFGKPDFSAVKLGPVFIGKFINATVNFLIVSVVIYFAVVLPMNKLREAIESRNKKEQEEANTQAEPPEDIKLLREILQTLKEQAKN